MGDGEEFYSPLIRSQSFAELCPWTVNFTSVSQFFPHLCGTGWLEGAGVGYFPSPRLDSDKIQQVRHW